MNKETQKAKTEMVSVPRKTLQSLIGSKLRGKSLFPKKVEEIKKVFSTAKLAK